MAASPVPVDLDAAPSRTGVWLVGVVVVALGGGFLAGWVRRHGDLEREAAAARVRADEAAEAERRVARAAEIESKLAPALDDAWAWKLRRRHDSWIARALARAAGVDDAADPARRDDEVLNEAVERLEERVAGLATLPALAAALDDWACMEHSLLHADGARKLSALALAIDPDPRRAELRDLLTASSAGRLRELVDAADVRRDPAPTLALLMKTLAVTGLADLAVRVGERAVEQRPDDFPLRIALADLLSERGPARRADARRHYHAALALRPSSARTWAHLGWLLSDRPEDDAAAVALTEVATRRVPFDAATLYVRGVALARARHDGEARMVFAQALAADPRCAPAQAALGDAFIGRDVLDPIWTAPPFTWKEDANGGSGRREEQAWRDQLDLAKEAYEQSLRLFDTPEGRDGLAAVLWAQGDDAGAAALLEEAVRRHPADSALRGHLATTLLWSGRRPDALAQWREAVRLDEWNAAPRIEYARQLANGEDVRLRRPGQAVEHARRAAEVDPEEAEAHRTLGIALYRVGEWGACILEIEAAMRIDRRESVLDDCFLAMAKQQLGDGGAARELLAQADAQDAPRGGEEERARAEAGELLGLPRSGR
jgi:tetratricopeptide (TPR) repeat protein